MENQLTNIYLIDLLSIIIDKKAIPKEFEITVYQERGIFHFKI